MDTREFKEGGLTCALIFERNIDRDNELRVSGGREFQSRGAEKALLPKRCSRCMCSNFDVFVTTRARVF